jgi:hypothetical protein
MMKEFKLFLQGQILNSLAHLTKLLFNDVIPLKKTKVNPDENGDPSSSGGNSSPSHCTNHC